MPALGYFSFSKTKNVRELTEADQELLQHPRWGAL